MCFQAHIKKYAKSNWAFEDTLVWEEILGNAKRQQGLQKYVNPMTDSVSQPTVFITIPLGFFTHTLFDCL